MTPRPWIDVERLEVLDLVERQGLPYGEVASRMSRSRNSICGLIFKIRTAIKEGDPTGHLDGSMPERWWERT